MEKVVLLTILILSLIITACGGVGSDSVEMPIHVNATYAECSGCISKINTYNFLQDQIGTFSVVIYDSTYDATITINKSYPIQYTGNIVFVGDTYSVAYDKYSGLFTINRFEDEDEGRFAANGTDIIQR